MWASAEQMSAEPFSPWDASPFGHKGGSARTVADARPCGHDPAARQELVPGVHCRAQERATYVTPCPGGLFATWSAWPRTPTPVTSAAHATPARDALFVAWSNLARPVPCTGPRLEPLRVACPRPRPVFADADAPFAASARSGAAHAPADDLPGTDRPLTGSAPAILRPAADPSAKRSAVTAHDSGSDSGHAHEFLSGALPGAEPAGGTSPEANCELHRPHRDGLSPSSFFARTLPFASDGRRKGARESNGLAVMSPLSPGPRPAFDPLQTCVSEAAHRQPTTGVPLLLAQDSSKTAPWRVRVSMRFAPGSAMRASDFVLLLSRGAATTDDDLRREIAVASGVPSAAALLFCVNGMSFSEVIRSLRNTNHRSVPHLFAPTRGLLTSLWSAG
jgi:hypothetical protein